MLSTPTSIPTNSALPAFIRSWLLRIHKRILLSSATLPEAISKLHDQRLPPVQQLPDEIILEILEHMIAATQSSSSIIASAELSAASVTQSLVRRQTFLAWVCRTCRSWYSVGTEVLYSSPLLTTTRKMELFERTLSDVPSLSRFVRAIYAPIHAGSTASDLLGWIFGHRSLTVQQEELSTILQHCPAVRSLTIRHCVRKGGVARLPVQDVLRAARLSDRIEHLSLHGSTFEARANPQFCVLASTASDVVLPQLRVLCLRGIYLLPSLHLPVLPRLHTLHLAENRYFGEGPFFCADHMPALRTLEVGGHQGLEAQLGLDRLLDEKCLAHLQSVRVVQHERCMVVTRGLPHGGQLRSVELGVLTPRDHTDAVCWCIPELLESLTFVIGGESKADVEDCLDAVLRCLRLNGEAKRLRELVVVHRFSHEGADSHMSENLLGELRTLCQCRGISFRIEALRDEGPYGVAPHARHG